MRRFVYVIHHTLGAAGPFFDGFWGSMPQKCVLLGPENDKKFSGQSLRLF
jgi:hypothetical protein